MRPALFHHCTLCKFFSEQKAIKMFQLFMIPSALTLDLSTCAALTVSYETSARVAQSAALDSEGSVYGGFDGFNHSNYTTSLTPNYTQSAFSRRAAILHVMHRCSGGRQPRKGLALQPPSPTKPIPRCFRSKEARANHLIEATKTRLEEASGGILLLQLSTWALGISSRNE